jgi:TatD DNase family protein
MHCFTGDWEFAKKSLDMGFYISFSGIVTFSSAKNIQEVATKVPHDRFMVETDAPYLAPAPYRGKTNEPAYVTHVAQFISTLRNCSYQQVCEETSSNFFNLFTAAAD